MWILFLLWGAKQIFNTGVTGSLLLFGLITGLFVWAGSFAVQDWIAGIIIKTENRYKPDDIISYRNTRGQITHLGHRSLTIESIDEKSIEIPYSKLVRETTLEKYPIKTACTTFNISIEPQKPFLEMQQTLQNIILCSPWSSILHKPEIRLVQRHGNYYCVEVVAYLIDQLYAAETETYVKTNFGENGSHSI
jgi:hypothetical protein